MVYLFKTLLVDNVLLRCYHDATEKQKFDLFSIFDLHTLLQFITRKYTIIDANLKLINAKIHSCYSIDIH